MPPGERAGFELPFLLIGAFRSLIDELHRTLAESGHHEARPLHGFALQAIGPEGSTASELGRRLGVSKQAAAKTVASLERVGYVRREPDPATLGRAACRERARRGNTRSGSRVLRDIPPSSAAAGVGAFVAFAMFAAPTVNAS